MSWDKIADIVVIGFGAAGATAAITAHDLGSEVVILEKTDTGGGNTAASGGAFLCPSEPDNAADYILALSSGSMDEDIVKTFVHEASKNVEWIVKLGAKIEPRGGASYPSVKGASSMRAYRLQGVGPGGDRLWSFLKGKVEERGIKVYFKTAATELIQDVTREVIGVEARNPDGETRIEAKRAVILSCGGFEYDDNMKKEFLHGPSFFSMGSPANTGDGIRMAQKAGADLWHMGAVAAPLGHKFPEFDAAFPTRLAHQNIGDPLSFAFIYVDRHGQRFMNELGVDNHLLWLPFAYFDLERLEYTRIPAYIIFDEATRLRGPIVRNQNGYNRNLYTWSEDNSDEIARGWIASGATIDELAQRIGVSQRLLSTSIEAYNNGCKQRLDPFGRPTKTLQPIDSPPYYAIKIHSCLLNTQGGPKRNSKAQVMDPYGKPIGKLYSAGELGSLWGFLYQETGNLGECLAFGRIAGMNAATEHIRENDFAF
ncbi:MAG: FAD-binding protein [Thaumarchaeota archaeon]|nr:FAD-binding protein [Nitrososphaerota archaeon]